MCVHSRTHKQMSIYNLLRFVCNLRSFKKCFTTQVCCFCYLLMMIHVLSLHTSTALSHTCNSFVQSSASILAAPDHTYKRAGLSNFIFTKKLPYIVNVNIFNLKFTILSLEPSKIHSNLRSIFLCSSVCVCVGVCVCVCMCLSSYNLLSNIRPKRSWIVLMVLMFLK